MTGVAAVLDSAAKRHHAHFRHLPSSSAMSLACRTRLAGAGTLARRLILSCLLKYILVDRVLPLKLSRSPAGVPCSYAFLADVYLPPLELLEAMVTHMAGMAPKRVPPAAAAAMLHYCTSLGVLPPAPASALFSYVHKCVPGLRAHQVRGLGGPCQQERDHNATACLLAAQLGRCTSDCFHWISRLPA